MKPTTLEMTYEIIRSHREGDIRVIDEFRILEVSETKHETHPISPSHKHPDAAQPEVQREHRKDH